eukprot:g6292.t1
MAGEGDRGEGDEHQPDAGGVGDALLEERWIEEQSAIAQAVIITDDVSWTLDASPATSPPSPTEGASDAAASPAESRDPSAPQEPEAASGSGGGSVCREEKGGAPAPSTPPGRRPLKLVGGVDISFVKGSHENACATLVVLEFPSLETVYEAYERVTMGYPYISGFLAFREVDHLARLVEQLRRERPDLEPDILFVDGNGRLHPRGAGLACHLGVVTGLRTVGLGKTFLQVDGLTKTGVRERVRTLLEEGEREMPLVGASGAVWGTALVPKEEEGRKVGIVTNPVFVSVGHRVSLETCVALTKAVGRYRVPEPIRQADMRSREVIREWLLERHEKEVEAKETPAS